MRWEERHRIERDPGRRGSEDKEWTAVMSLFLAELADDLWACRQDWEKVRPRRKGFGNIDYVWYPRGENGAPVVLVEHEQQRYGGRTGLRFVAKKLCLAGGKIDPSPLLVLITYLYAPNRGDRWDTTAIQDEVGKGLQGGRLPFLLVIGPEDGDERPPNWPARWQAFIRSGLGWCPL
jgi:hypothetical protein